VSIIRLIVVPEQQPLDLGVSDSLTPLRSLSVSVWVPEHEKIVGVHLREGSVVVLLVAHVLAFVLVIVKALVGRGGSFTSDANVAAADPVTVPWFTDEVRGLMLQVVPSLLVILRVRLVRLIPLPG
jgi:hypothetical protein